MVPAQGGASFPLECGYLAICCYGVWLPCCFLLSPGIVSGQSTVVLANLHACLPFVGLLLNC